MTHTIANHGLYLLQNNSIWWFNVFFHHFSQKSHPRLGWLVGHHCTHGFIPDWDEHVLPWPKNNTQNLINFKCTCLLCIATTGRTMFCMGGILNVGQCGSSQPGMTHTIANHGLDLLQNISIWWFNMFSTIFRSQKSPEKVIPDWDDLCCTISHMDSSQSGMTSPHQTSQIYQK